MKKWKTNILIIYLSLLVTAFGCENGDTTKPDDTQPSPVATQFPQGDATDVERDAVISATFREDMDSSTINTNTFTLSYNPLVSGTVTYDKSTRTATFTPDSLLQYSTTYTVTITAGVKNASGTPLASNVSWSFATIGVKPIASLPRTGQTASYATGDDGAITAGVVWPSPRFNDNLDGTITDNLTGLMWLKDGSCLGYQSWQYGARWAIDSLNFDPGCLDCQDYTAPVYTDWRLPNVNELESLINAGQNNTALWLNGLGFTGIQAIDYWSSTSVAQDPNKAWSVNMWVGFVDPNDKGNRRILAVRGETTAPAPLWKTGQVTSYRPGDDGDLQEGILWPYPRFAGSGKKADCLTGLEWLENADTPTLGYQGSCPGGMKTWQEALDYIACLNDNNVSGKSDWRLPNRKELFSLIDRSQYGPALPENHHFINVQNYYYWTSTTYAYNTSQAWIVNMNFAWTDPIDKTSTAWVWPVRGGQ